MKPTPTRRRRLATAETIVTPSAELVSLAAQVLQANTAMNAATRLHSDLRKKLLGEMRDSGFRDFSATALINGKNISFEAIIASGVRTSIDVAKLRTLVGDDVFMACVSASKTSVEQNAGAAVATQCSVTTAGEENVTVKPAKA